MDIYIHNGSEPAGPFTPEDLSALWGAGEIEAHAFYWYEGMPTWLSVAQFQAPPADGPTIKPRAVIVTTAPSVANREIDRERDIVTAEHAIATAESALAQVGAVGVRRTAARMPGCGREARD